MALEHPYPSKYPPGCHWATDEAWQILDALPVGMLSDDLRFLTAGRIAGTLSRVASKPSAAWRTERELLLNIMQAASHALKSYQFGNDAPDLAAEVAKLIDRAIAAAKTV